MKISEAAGNEGERDVEIRNSECMTFGRGAVREVTIADHIADAAAGTIITGGLLLLTVEFKTNLLRPWRDERIVRETWIFKPGKR